MARCQICNKTGQSGNNVSHSKRRTRTRWFANVQRTTIVRDGRPQKVARLHTLHQNRDQVVDEGLTALEHPTQPIMGLRTLALRRPV